MTCLSCSDKERHIQELKRLLHLRDNTISALRHRIDRTVRANDELQQSYDTLRLKHMTDEERERFHEERVAWIAARYGDGILPPEVAEESHHDGDW